MASQKLNILYARLSQEDDRAGDSNSVINQRRMLEKYAKDVKHSFSASSRPLDNAVAETFFSTFKREEAYLREYTSEQHFRRSVEEYIRFYNEVRPHQTLNFKTPQAFEENFQSNFIGK